MESKGLSRRSFLKGSVVTGAALAGAAALAGCSTSADAAANPLAEIQKPENAIPENWDAETDIVVVGYGGAGMWASLIGADEGGSSVTVLEKAPVEGGGNSRINNGEWTVIKDADKFKAYCTAFSQGQMEEKMIDAYIAEAERHTEYADKYGMTYEVAEQALAGTIPEYWFLDDGAYAGIIGVADVEGFGMTTFHELDAKREELGVDVQFDCHDEHLIQNPATREIVGVRYTQGSEEKTIKAKKGVILTCGGFEFNEELKNKYLKIHPFKFEGWEWNTGDGIRMVEEVGAKLWHMDMVISTTAMWTRDPEYDFAIFASPQSDAYFNVNRLGKRFQNESKTGGTAHNGWHTLMSFDDSIADYDRIPRVDHLRPEGHRRRPDGHPAGRLVRVRQLHHRPAGRDPRMGRLVRRQPGGDRARLGAEGRHAGRPREQDHRVRRQDGLRQPQGHLRRVPRLLRCRQGRALRPRAVGREQALRVRPVLRHLHLSRLLLHAGRPEEERVRAGGGPGG